MTLPTPVTLSAVALRVSASQTRRRYQKDAAGWRTSCAPIKTILRAELKQLELWVKGLNLNHTGGKRLNYPWLDEYLLSKKSATKDFKVEWQWDRYQIGNKLFAAICYGENDKQILTVKCEPEFGTYLREKYSDITPGYYMNKTHWNSVDLNGSVPETIIKDMIEQSYKLVLNSFSKKRQIELIGEKL